MEERSIREIIGTPIEMYYNAGLISARAFNICKYNDIDTVGDLFRDHKEGKLLFLRNCGKKTLKELEQLIEIVGCPRTDDPEIERPDSIRDVLEKHYYTPLLGFSKDCIDLFYSIFEHPSSFYSFFCENQVGLAERFNSISELELKLYCYQILSEILSSIRKEYQAETTTCETIIIARAILWFCDDHFAEAIEATDFDLKVRRGVLLADFADRIGKLSSRASRVQRSLIPNYLKAIMLFPLTEKQLKEYLFPGKFMRTTAAELTVFKEELKDVFYRYESLGGNALTQIVISNKYSYLSEEQIGFVSDYYLQHGGYPMFFLLQQYLLKSDNRMDRLFAMYTGICDGHSKSLAEIGKELGYTRERIRQIVGIAAKNLFKKKEWKNYHFDKIFVITQDDEIYTDVVSKEKVDISFELFARICTLGFPLKTIKEEGSLFLVNQRFDNAIINKAIRDIGRLSVKKKTEDVCYKIDDLLKEVPTAKKDAYKQVLAIIIEKVYGIAFGEEGNIVFHKNGISVLDELCDILRCKGNPMSLTELFEELKQGCPEIKYNEPQQIRSVILRSERIKPIGKTSKYTLTEWCNVFKGSIRDLVAQILMNAEKPVHIDGIMGQVLPFYPETNKRSVVTSINNDKERFRSFGDGYYGLVGKDYECKSKSKRNPKRPSSGGKEIQLTLLLED